MSVYFATAGGYVKIGYSADPIRRVSTITRNGKRPDDLPYKADARLVGWIPGDQWRETEIHARFTGNRVAGEWFGGIDLNEIRELIWDDPRGVDMQRMSAMAVFAADKHRDLTRDEIEAAGIPVLAVTDAEAHGLDDAFAEALMQGGAA